MSTGFRHVVLFRWKPGTGERELQALERALEALPRAIPEIRAYRFGRDAGVANGNFDFAIVADFADESAWRRYVDHPAHAALVAERVRPILAERAATQIRVELD
ncbi:MAG TPA: Dabb family protein [Myxococcota bacterium]|nr:Dabb family protein [Myxococcota bacterium]